jgi:hypothetical protein
MSLRIVCSGHLVRHPVGGHSWHHLQYLVGFLRLGYRVTFFEDYGWPNSCYDVSRDEMTADPSYGITYLESILRPFGLEQSWCYLAEDGTALGMTRGQLAAACRDADVYFNLSNINWIPELEECRRRVLVDTDPVFTQVGRHGIGGAFSRYHVRFTYGENVHRPGCAMPTGGTSWLSTRQPVVLDAWAVSPGDATGPFTTVMSWAPYADLEYQGQALGQKDRQFMPFYSLPHSTGQPMELLVTGVPAETRRRLVGGGWRVADPLTVTRDPWQYQGYLRASRAEFCVAKHGYVVTRCGWFSDRSAGYMASGRPVVIEDTGFSDFLPTGRGLLSYRTPAEALARIREVQDDYHGHCRAARALVEEYFDAGRVLTDLLSRSV